VFNAIPNKNTSLISLSFSPISFYKHSIQKGNAKELPRPQKKNFQPRPGTHQQEKLFSLSRTICDLQFGRKNYSRALVEPATSPTCQAPVTDLALASLAREGFPLVKTPENTTPQAEKTQSIMSLTDFTLPDNVHLVHYHSISSQAPFTTLF